MLEFLDIECDENDRVQEAGFTSGDGGGQATGYLQQSNHTGSVVVDARRRRFRIVVGAYDDDLVRRRSSIFPVESGDYILTVYLLNQIERMT